MSEIKSFFSSGYSSETGEKISPRYTEKVLVLDKKYVVNVSLKWLELNGAITKKDIKIYETLRRYRNKLTHELLDNLFEGIDQEEFTRNLSALLELRIKVEKWWILTIDIPTNDFDDLIETSKDDIVTDIELIYHLFTEMLSENEEQATYYWKEI